MGEVFEELYPPSPQEPSGFGVFWCTDKWTPPASEPYHRPFIFFKKMTPSPSLLWMAPCTAYPPALMEISTTPSLTMGWMLMLRYYVQFLPCFFLPTKCNLEYQISECLCNLIPRPAVKTCGSTQNFLQCFVSNYQISATHSPCQDVSQPRTRCPAYCVHVLDAPLHPPSNPDGVPYNTIIDKNGMDDEGHAQILWSISALFYFSFSLA